MAAGITDTKRLFKALLGEAIPTEPDVCDATEVPAGLEVARRLFADFGLDKAQFYGRYEITLKKAATRLETRDQNTSDPLTGLRGTAALLAQAVEASARLSVEGGAATAADIPVLTARLQAPEVVTTLRRLYGLGDPPQDTTSVPDAFRDKLLNSLDWANLVVHRVGTTSMILRGSPLLSDREYIIKLVHFLFQGVGPINDATRRYYKTVKAARAGCKHVADVLASGDGWIIQEYVPGPTVAEYVATQTENVRKGPALRTIELLSSVYIPTVDALASLHKAVTHGDLNPSNIILQNRDIPDDLAGDDLIRHPVAIRFVDLGRNLLASEVIGRVKSPDAHFVAPEVVSLAPDARSPERSADYYSLGLLLPVCVGVASADELRGGRIPEGLFAQAPLLARVMADLADPEAAHRLDALRRDFPSKPRDLKTLAEYLKELESSMKDAAMAPTGARGVVSVVVEALGGIRRPARGARRLAKALDIRNLPQAREYRYLAWWSAAATVAFWLSVLVIGTSVWARYGKATAFDPLTFTSDQLRVLLAKIGFVLNGARNGSYNQACAVGGSFALACYLYYLKSFGLADLRRAPPRSRLAVMSEVLLRIQTMLVLPFVVVGNFFAPGDWLWFSAVGIGVVALNNWVMLRRQTEVIAELDEATSSPGQALVPMGYWAGVESSKRLSEWVPTLSCFAALLALLAGALSLGYGRDYAIYAVWMTTVNVLFFGYVQATRRGPEIASSLARTAILAERRHLASPPSSNVDPAGEDVRVDSATTPRAVRAPVAVASATPDRGVAPVAISLDGSGSSGVVAPLSSYVWDFGDGSPAGSGPTVSHTYAASGTYQASLTVTDTSGQSDTTKKTIVVSATDQPPTPSLDVATDPSNDAHI